MSAEILNSRLRSFLLITAVFVFLGTLAELVLEEHYGSPTQLIPFVLSILGLIFVLLTLWRPQRGYVLALRAAMIVITLGGLFGVFEHVLHNFQFALEIRPNAMPADVLWDALSGASPLMAPGILALGAILALAATYYHPALQVKG